MLPIVLLVLVTMAGCVRSHESRRRHLPPTDHPIPVTSLPGLSGPLPSDIYSGYVNIETIAQSNQTMLLHYVLMESENGPDSGPTLIWYNGGPGRSSLWGMMVELGPLLLNDASLTTLQRNPYAWTKFANVLALDNPPPVGFSFCDPPGAWWPNGTSCGPWDDERVGRTNAEAIFKIFTIHFPSGKYVKNGFRFVGESYGGVYIVETAQALLDNATYANVSKHLTGIGFGDATLGGQADSTGVYWNLLFLYGHGQMSTETWEGLLDACTMDQLRGKSPMTPQCSANVTGATAEVGPYFLYNLYDNCPPTTFSTYQQRPRKASPASPRVGYDCPGTCSSNGSIGRTYAAPSESHRTRFSLWPTMVGE